MSRAQVVVRGTLRPDGTLDLADRPALPAGPVEVVISALPMADDAREDWWHYLQRARAELEAAGHRFLTEDEVNASIAELRSSWDDDRIDEIHRQAEAGRHRASAGDADLPR